MNLLTIFCRYSRSYFIFKVHWTHFELTFVMQKSHVIDLRGQSSFMCFSRKRFSNSAPQLFVQFVKACSHFSTWLWNVKCKTCFPKFLRFAFNIPLLGPWPSVCQFMLSHLETYRYVKLFRLPLCTTSYF